MAVCNNIWELAYLVAAGKLIKINPTGKWSVRGLIFSFILYFLGLTKYYLTSAALNFILILDNLEKERVQFAGQQKVDFAAYLAVADALCEKLQHYRTAKCSQVERQLRYRSIALRYRLEQINGGWDKEEEPSLPLLEKLQQHARDWKSHQEILVNKNLTLHDHEQLRATASYLHFAELILGNDILRDKFFTFALRDSGNIDLFVQFPGWQEKLCTYNLQGRLGRMAETEMLKVAISSQTDGSKKKILSMLFEGQHHNILDDQAVITFRGNYSLTIAEILNVFKNKNAAVGNLEIMADGIVNWNVHKLGWWNADKGDYEIVPLMKRDWWRLLPIFETISKKEARVRYGTHLDGRHWNAAATATRGSATLDYDKSHAYLEMAIPMRNGYYAIYDFGKSATRLPATFLECVAMFCHTVVATVAYPDENVFYTHRQHAQHSFILTAKQGNKLLDLIRFDLVKARAGNFVYQIESENCAKWVHENLEAICGKLGNLFQMRLLDTEPFGVVAWIFGFIRFLPDALQLPLLTFFHFILGAYQKIWILENCKFVCKSLRYHDFWFSGIVYLPAFLHHQLHRGVLRVVSAVTKAKAMLTNRQQAVGPRNVHALIYRKIASRQGRLVVSIVLPFYILLLSYKSTLSNRCLA